VKESTENTTAQAASTHGGSTTMAAKGANLCIPFQTKGHLIHNLIFQTTLATRR